jgi:hypothetical protein
MRWHAGQAGIEVRFFDIPGKDMTLVGNADALPTFEQATESISAMEYYRWTGRRISGELLVKTGRVPHRSVVADGRV